jgi:hypothetical protein
MKLLAFAALVLVGCSSALPAAAGPGDVYVPAHRTADGSWVPANVPPSSGGTRMARKLPVRSAKPAAAAAALPASPTAPPLLIAVEPVRR